MPFIPIEKQIVHGDIVEIKKDIVTYYGTFTKGTILEVVGYNTKENTFTLKDTDANLAYDVSGRHIRFLNEKEEIQQTRTNTVHYGEVHTPLHSMQDRRQ